MRKLILATLFLITTNPFYGQKKSIDTSAYRNWPSLSDLTISNDGRYAKYTIRNHSIKGDLHVLTSVDLKWKTMLPIGDGAFSNKSQFFIFLSKNELGIKKLGTADVKYVPEVVSYQVSKQSGHNWVAYLLGNNGADFVIQDLDSGKKKVFHGVSNYQFSEDENILLLEKKDSSSNNTITSLSWVDLLNNISTPVWNGVRIEKKIFSKSNDRIAFIVNNDDDIGRSCWYYEIGSNKAKLLVDDSIINKSGKRLVDIIRFSSDSKRLFFTFRYERPAPDPNSVRLDIWNYKDKRLQALQLKQLESRIYLAGIFTDDKAEIILQEEDDDFCDIKEGVSDEWAMIENYKLSPGSAEESSDFYLVNTKDGRRIKMDQRGEMSPTGKYLVYWDKNHRDFFSLEISTGTIKNITQNISTEWRFNEYDVGYARGIIAGWSYNGKGVLLYDQYDIWYADVENERPPINLTNGYGRKAGIMFYLSESNPSISYYMNEKVILTAFNINTKENGFYKTTLGRKMELQLLTMGPFVYDLTRNPYVPNTAHFEFVKAKAADVYIVQRQSAVEAPNYFLTKDFKRFARLTDVNPEKKYNWYTTELHEWKTLEGSMSKGILYKPEDFSYQNKYPVIFYYYDKLSDNLNIYLPPKASDGRLNITWFVSNGYLVFTPDIHYTKGDAFSSCYNAVVSAAKYLSKKSYVDSSRMGIQGMSWGGFQTNYLITQTNLFSAACSASGISDFISHYNSFTHGGYNAQASHEIGRHGPTGSLWSHKDWYIKNSPIMNADKVFTPLLMFHTSFDDACAYSNAVELYLALRRLGRKVWFLEYNDGNHGVYGKSAIDFDLRLQQFFNYYLRGFPPPVWMTKGVYARDKQIETGLEVDMSGDLP